MEFHVRSAGCLPGSFSEHVGLGVDADRFGNVACQRQCELTSPTAKVEQTAGAV
nr:MULTISPECIES: hypothetical protein [unclassified Mycobacterium]